MQFLFQYKMETSRIDKPSEQTSPPNPHTKDSSFSSETESNGKVRTSPASNFKVSMDAKHVTFEQAPQEGDKKGTKDSVTSKNSVGTRKPDGDQLDRKMSSDQSKSPGMSHGGEISKSRVEGSSFSSCNSVTKELSNRRYKKGLNAQFLRQNPRFVNEPICHVLPNEMSASVGDCMQWGDGRVKGQTENQQKM